MDIPVDMPTIVALFRLDDIPRTASDARSCDDLWLQATRSATPGALADDRCE